MSADPDTGPGEGEASERAGTARWAQAERLRLVFRNLPSALAVSTTVVCILAALLRHAVRPMPLLGWTSAGILISLFRYSGYRQFRRARPPLDVRRWSRRLTLGTGISGVFWGSSAVVLFSPDDLAHQVVIAFVLAGLCAGAMTSYAAIRQCYLAFVLPTIVPIAVRMAMEPNETDRGMAFLTVLFLALIIRSAIETDRTIGKALSVRAENTRLLRELRHQATHDGLVELPNQREFQTRLLALTQSSTQHRRPCALLFVDLDRFKQINDTGGHAAGDAALREVGQLLRKHVRPNDTAARIGGDEFAVLLPDTSRDRGETVALRILTAINQLVLSWDGGQQFRLGASIGLAYSDSGECEASALLRAADAACYAAKLGGRSRLEILAAQSDCESSGRFEISRLRQSLS